MSSWCGFRSLARGRQKRRPAVVVSNRAYSITRPDLILMAITSQLRPNPGTGDAWISHWQAAGLLKPSVVKPVFATLEQRLVLRRPGALDDDDRAALSHLELEAACGISIRFMICSSLKQT